VEARARSLTIFGVTKEPLGFVLSEGICMDKTELGGHVLTAF